MMTSAIGWIQKVALAVLVVVSTSAGARDLRSGAAELPLSRALYLSKNPQQEVPEIFVAGDVVTTLRFESPCDPSRTKLLGWEERFEPLLVGGRSVVLVPLKNLDPGDRFMLLVTLLDGTALPFTVTASEARVDRQVNVFPDPESPQAVRLALEQKRQENTALRDENRRQHEEGTSVDHALAALLANGQVEMTPFKEGEKWLLNDEGLEIEIRIFVPKNTKKRVAKTKVGVVFRVANKEPMAPWELQEARLSAFTTWQPKPFALRATSSSIDPGKTGYIAIVADLGWFDPAKDDDKLVLELFRNGGRRQAYVELIPSNLLR